MLAMNDVNVLLFFAIHRVRVLENSWKEQQTLFACVVQEKRRGIRMTLKWFLWRWRKGKLLWYYKNMRES